MNIEKLRESAIEFLSMKLAEKEARNLVRIDIGCPINLSIPLEDLISEEGMQLIADRKYGYAESIVDIMLAWVKRELNIEISDGDTQRKNC